MSERQIAVLDYGIGNIHSVAKALRAAGSNPLLTSSPEDVRKADLLVVPGVGAFADCMGCLVERSLDQPVLDFIRTGRPFLGICVGMQMLFSESLEFGTHPGLGVIEGAVERLKEEVGIKIPHVGWNAVQAARPWAGSLLDDVQPGDMLYFTHSFTATPTHENNRLADTQYGSNRICAAVQVDNVMGTQFHPEKSGDLGLKILQRFIGLK